MAGNAANLSHTYVADNIDYLVLPETLNLGSYNYGGPIGDTINLNLIAPTVIDGKFYYFLDNNLNGVVDNASGADEVNHGVLDSLFNNGFDTVATGALVYGSNDERSNTIGAYTVGLPTVDELLAIYNSPLGNPPDGWQDSDVYWAADKVGGGPESNMHKWVNLTNGTVGTTMPNADDGQTHAVALQVLFPG